MTQISPSYEVSFNAAFGEVRSKIGGFWSEEQIATYFDALNEASMPMVIERKPIHALVEFDDFVPQNKATSDAIRAHLMQSQKFGLVRLAIVRASALVKMQYRRLSDGIVVEFFETVAEGEVWLRKDQSA